MKMRQNKSRNRFVTYSIGAVLAVGLFALAGILPSAEAKGKAETGIIPPDEQAYGRSYSDLAEGWWRWAAAIPAAENPVLDETGEFAGVGQRGPIWFLAGGFGGTIERTVTIPDDKVLFVPICNTLWWAPEDLEAAMGAAEQLGLDPTQMTDEELIRFVANLQVASEFITKMEVEIDGVQVQDLEQYRAESDPFLLRPNHTDLLNDFGIPVSQPNLSITAGYFLMLNPLPQGSHTIHFIVLWENPIFGAFELDVTYNLTVVEKGKQK